MHNLQIPQTRLYEQGSTNKVLQTRTTFKHWSRYSPTSSQGRVLVKQASVAAYLTRFAIIFSPTIHSMQENKEITTNELCMRTTFQRVLNQEFFFGSQVVVFSRDPSCLKCWLLHPCFLRGSHMQKQYHKRTTLRSKSSTIKGLLYAPDPEKTQERDAK